ncbi:MAG: STAS domain-containing protein [Candidatus Eisenbacteria bacterium]|nr:STAS domain-containing protein [Candidatus Eisenbacteria bacterium]
MWNKPTLEYKQEPLGDASGAMFRPSGKLIGTRESYDFLDSVRKFLHEGGRTVLIDLSGVDRVTSPGVGILAALYTTAIRANARIALVAVPEAVRSLLKVVLLWDLLPHYETKEEALNAKDAPGTDRPQS